VQYRNLLAAIKVQWCALGQGQTAALAEAMLRAELNLDSLKDLFDYSRDGEVSPAELRRSLGLLLPNLSSEQVRHVQKLIGHSTSEPFSQLMGRLLQFLPPLALEEEWMGGTLAHLGQVIQRWAGDGVELHAALLQFYTVFDEDRDGILSPEEMLKAFMMVEQRSLQDTASAGKVSLTRLARKRLEQLVQQLDTNQSETISFLEFARAFQKRQPAPQGQKSAEDYLPLAHTVWTASIFVHRAALVRCCLLMDTTGSGNVSTRNFLSAVEALGRILGRPFAAGDLLALEESIGDTLLDYQSALNDFSVSFDSRLATRMTQSIMVPF